MRKANASARRTRQRKRIIQLLEQNGELSFFDALEQGIHPAVFVSTANQLRREGSAYFDSPILKTRAAAGRRTTDLDQLISKGGRRWSQ